MAKTDAPNTPDKPQASGRDDLSVFADDLRRLLVGDTSVFFLIFLSKFFNFMKINFNRLAAYVVAVFMLILGVWACQKDLDKIDETKNTAIDTPLSGQSNPFDSNTFGYMNGSDFMPLTQAQFSNHVINFLGMSSGSAVSNFELIYWQDTASSSVISYLRCQVSNSSQRVSFAILLDKSSDNVYQLTGSTCTCTSNDCKNSGDCVVDAGSSPCGCTSCFYTCTKTHTVSTSFSYLP